MAQLVESDPVKWRVAGLIPCQGRCLVCRFVPLLGCLWEATNRCLSLISMFLTLSFFLLSPSSKIKKKSLFISSNFTLRFLARRNENICPHKNLCHANILHSNQKRKAIQTSTTWWMGKQNVVYPYVSNRMLFSNKGQWSTGTYYSVDVPQKHCGWVKEVRKHHGSIHMVCSDRQICGDGK